MKKILAAAVILLVSGIIIYSARTEIKIFSVKKSPMVSGEMIFLTEKIKNNF